MKYAALLRGINVGGNNKVPMKNVVLLFESAGFTNVSTYINCTNITLSLNLINMSWLGMKGCPNGCKLK